MKIVISKKKLLIYLMKQVFLFASLKKKHNQSGAKYTQNIYHNAG